MPYPTANPVNKHDVVGPPPPSSSAAADGDEDLLLPTTESILSRLTHPPTPADNASVGRIGTVYTYPDAPTKPKPLSRTLTIVGYADMSSSLVRNFTNDGMLSTYATKCHLGVKRADSTKYRSHLKPHDVSNSDNFAKFAVELRERKLAAIVGVDPLGRLGVIRAMEEEDYGGGSSSDYAVELYVGNLEEVKNGLQAVQTNGAAAAAESEPTSFDYAGEEEESGGGTASAGAEEGLWQPPGTADGGKDDGDGDGDGDGGGMLWQPPGMADGDGDGTAATGGFANGEHGFETAGSSWEPTATTGFEPVQHAGQKRPRPEEDASSSSSPTKKSSFHADSGAATADAFYSGLVRSLDTRADSWLFHMRSFNGWVKATQIAELDPRTSSKKKQPLRILDLACGKGGDLGKWTIHPRGVRNYVGVDVARGSLKDAAIRARKMRKQLKDRCTFTCADLGYDVPGRPRTGGGKVQKLLSWSLSSEQAGGDNSGDPVFERQVGGGISSSDRFDVVSIQFAIHYMMSSRKRAMRFFQTVSELLDVGGNLIATTIDSRVVLYHLMDLGLDLNFGDDDNDGGDDGDDGDGHGVGGGAKKKAEEGATVTVGGGACRIKFDGDIVRKIFKKPSGSGGADGDGGTSENYEGREYMDKDLFGLQYTFTLVEGQDHSAGVGEAVDLPEWLSPLPALTSLAREAGFELEYATNFHEFYAQRQDPRSNHTAHNALYNMKVLDRNGSISKNEWEISRLYCAIKFRKVRESRLVLDDDEWEEDDESEDEEVQAIAPPVVADATQNQEPASEAAVLSNPKAKAMLPMAMMKAKRVAGEEVWNNLSSEEKKQRTNEELKKML